MPALGSSMGDRPPGSSLALGEIVAGKYRIEREIGRGGMGIVFSATHLTLDRLVAIKVMKHELLQDDRALKRLVFEAKSAAKIESEHVARVLDVEVLPNGVPYIVMEYLDGQDLGALIDHTGALSVQQSVTFILQACEALAEVHVANLVHRDLKPGNLFIAKRADGSPAMKIVDFGISKYVGGPGAKVAKTTSPHVLGSPFYMAPEQMRADSVDARSDIWALGAILFEMLTARTPFTGDTLPEVYAAVLGEPPPPVNELKPDVPAALDGIVRRCLEKDPFLRFSDVAALARELAPFGSAGSQQSVDRISRVINRQEGGEDSHLLGRSSDFSTFQAGTPLGYVEAEEQNVGPLGAANVPGQSDSGSAGAADKIPPTQESARAHDDRPAALAVAYPPDGSENEDSVRRALSDVGSGKANGFRVKETVVIRQEKSRKLLLSGVVSAVAFVAGLTIWLGATSSDESFPDLSTAPLPSRARTLLPGDTQGGEAAQAVIPAPKERAKPNADGLTPRAEVTGAEAPMLKARLAEPQKSAGAAEKNANGDEQKIRPANSPSPARPKKSSTRTQARSSRPSGRQGSKTGQQSEGEAVKSRVAAKISGGEKPKNSESQSAQSRGKRPKKDYWNSESFGARR